MMMGWDFARSDAGFVFFFFFLFGRWITAHDSYHSRRRSMVLLRLISPTPGDRSNFHSSFWRTITKVLCWSWGIAIAVREVTLALWKKKERKFSKITSGRSRSSQKKMPGDGADVSKRPPRHRRNQNPQSLNVWRQIFQKRGKQKTLRKGHISGKKRVNLELRTKIVPREPRPKLSRVAESLPRPQLVIHPWRIYPSYGHWDDHFDDGYIRHVALNGLSFSFCRATAKLSDEGGCQFKEETPGAIGGFWASERNLERVNKALAHSHTDAAYCSIKTNERQSGSNASPMWSRGVSVGKNPSKCRNTLTLRSLVKKPVLHQTERFWSVPSSTFNLAERWSLNSWSRWYCRLFQ